MEPTRPPRDPLSESAWRDHVAAWKSSGQCAREYAAQHDLNPATLYSWRRKLRARDAQRATRATRLLPVTVEAARDCEIVLPDGRRLRFPDSLPAATLRAILDVLERS